MINRLGSQKCLQEKHKITDFQTGFGVMFALYQGRPGIQHLSVSSVEPESRTYKEQTENMHGQKMLKCFIIIS